MRKIEREPNGAGIFKPGQDLVVAGTVGKNGVKAALSAKEKEISARFPEWFVKRIREQADKKSELTPEMLNACGAGEWEEISEIPIFGKNASPKIKIGSRIIFVMQPPSRAIMETFIRPTA